MIHAVPRKKRAKARIPVLAPGASRFRLRIGRSPIEGYGVFAAQDIPPRIKVIEYTGGRVLRWDLKKRAKEYMRRHGKPPRYLFRLNRDWSVDGEVGGSGAERINHCCDPNLVTRKVSGRILYLSRRIRRGEELTIDYKFRRTNPLIPCHCRSPKCRGTMNLRRRVRRPEQK